MQVQYQHLLILTPQNKRFYELLENISIYDIAFEFTINNYLFFQKINVPNGLNTKCK